MLDNKTFEGVYTFQIHAVFGKEFYKHAIFINTMLIMFCLLLCVFFSDLQNTAQKIKNELAQTKAKMLEQDCI